MDGSWHIILHFISLKSFRKTSERKGLNNGHWHQHRLSKKDPKCWLFVPFHVKIFFFLIAFFFWEFSLLLFACWDDWLIPEIIDYKRLDVGEIIWYESSGKRFKTNWDVLAQLKTVCHLKLMRIFMALERKECKRVDLLAMHLQQMNILNLRQTTSFPFSKLLCFSSFNYYQG